MHYKFITFKLFYCIYFNKMLRIFQLNPSKIWPLTGSEIEIACKFKMLDT